MPGIFRRRHDHQGENYGPHEIEQAVEVAEFPTTRAALAERYGAKAVQIEEGHAVDLKSVLDRIPEERFESATDVAAAAARVWPQIRGIPPYTGYPGELSWSDESPAPEAQEHVAEERAGLSGDQHRLT